MGEEIVDLIIRLGIEVDEKGNIKTANKDLKEIEHLLEKIGSSKGYAVGKLNKENDSLNPDKQIISDLKEKIKFQDKWLEQLREQKRLLSSPNIEKAVVSFEDIKNANNIRKSISIPENAKLIQESFLTNEKGEETWVGIYQAFVEEDGKRLVKTYKQIGDEVRVETNKLRKGLVEYTSADSPLIGQLYKTKLNPENNDVIQWTKQVIGDLQIVRKYINGILVDEQRLTKEQKTKSTEAPLPTPKKNSFDKFIARVKNIVVYRLVREVMSAVQKSITEGFNLISVNNSSVKNMLTEFKASSISLSVSLSTMLLPIMQSLSSLLNTIGMQFIDVANEMSRQNAIAKGQATYYKINKDAVNDYAKSLTQLSGNLSQLDKFATLSGTNTPILGGNVDIAEQSGITEESQGKLKLFQKVLKGIGDIITYVKDNFDEIIKSLGTFIGLLIGAKLIIGIGNLVKGFGEILNFMKNINLQSIGLIAGVSLLAIAFSSDLPVALKVLAGAFGGLIATLAVVYALKEGISHGVAWTIASFGAMIGGIGAFIAGLNNVADSGSSSVDLSSATNISSLMGGVASSGSYSQSVSVAGGSNSVQGDVYLDGYKVGNILSQRINTNFVKAGYAKGR